ncbi:TetR/AcrR family transcriptional regulator [Pseudonocardiaceae bacterium YIM PH 21723]|nr:TetR/AcrR family transcriptional regulator [Pseudonocardiaceae bacterium YIM PH 21723]
MTPRDAQDPVLSTAAVMFLQDNRVDMQALSKLAGLSRATLYRRYGDRGQLLGAAFWQFAEPVITELRAGIREEGLRGAEAVAEQVGRSLHFVAEIPQVRNAMKHNAEQTLRVMTSKHGIVQRGLVAFTTEMIIEEIGDPDIPPATLAYGVVRIGESFFYRELITGEPQDIDSAILLIRKLLS